MKKMLFAVAAERYDPEKDTEPFEKVEPSCYFRVMFSVFFFLVGGVAQWL